MEKLTFENLPDAVAELLEKVEKIELLLIGKTVDQSQDKELICVKEAATFLKLSVPTVYSKVCRGEIPACKPGRRLYFDKTLLIENIKKFKKKSNTELAIDVEPFSKKTNRRAVRW